MSMSSWTIITISLFCFAAAVMITTFLIIAKTWKRYREGSPLRLNNYSKRRPPARAVFEGAPRPLSAGQVCSLRSLHANYESDSAVEVERHSRHIMDKSSAFEYWWYDNKFIDSKPSGHFYTIPMFYHGVRKDSGKKVNRLEKKVNVDVIPKRNAVSWPSNIDRSGYDSARDEDEIKRETVEAKGDLKL